jgi:hypothetical protein
MACFAATAGAGAVRALHAMSMSLTGASDCFWFIVRDATGEERLPTCRRNLSQI